MLHRGSPGRGIDIQSGEEVALKLVHINDDPYIFEGEAAMYRAVGGVGIPRALWSGQEGDYYVLAY